MIRCWTAITRFDRGEAGASLVEYSILLLLIAVVTIGAISSFGSALSSYFASMASSV
jgi:Flp pilus assembly pilin Flp